MRLFIDYKYTFLISNLIKRKNYNITNFLYFNIKKFFFYTLIKKYIRRNLKKITKNNKFDIKKIFVPIHIYVTYKKIFISRKFL